VHDEKTGFFGFFDCINDASVASALFENAAGHLSGSGLVSMRGPMSFSTNDECGMLLEGYDERPMIMMPYNPPYYNELMERSGFSKAKDLYAYIYDVREKLPEKVLRVAALVEKRGITVRPMDMKHFVEDMMIFRDVYHSAWEKNWGFVPISEAELKYSAERLRQVIIPDMILIAEEAGRPVGFLGMVPDVNLVLKHMNGSMGPLSLARALYYSRRIRDLRAMLLGVKKEFRNKGVEALLFRDGFSAIKRGNFKRVEFSWILEDNTAVQRTIETMQGRLYKKYRIYEKPL
jgi:GNAT superfamily N-acetyltransferase